jgi:hypothetical protein
VLIRQSVCRARSCHEVIRREKLTPLHVVKNVEVCEIEAEGYETEGEG